MTELALRFILDENMPVELANQLNQRRIDTLTVRDLGKLGEDDPPLLIYASELGRVLCTYDHDYVDMAKRGAEHAGIVFIPGAYRGIGVMVRYFELLHAVYNPDEMKNKVEYLFG